MGGKSGDKSDGKKTGGKAKCPPDHFTEEERNNSANKKAVKKCDQGKKIQKVNKKGKLGQTGQYILYGIYAVVGIIVLAVIYRIIKWVTPSD